MVLCTEARMCCCGCCTLLLVIIVAIVGAGIGYVDYFEYGLVRGDFTGINYDILYGAGRHYIQPFHAFIELTKTVQFLELDNLAVYSKDDGSGNSAGGIAGTPLEVSVMVQYFLIEDQVIPLFKRFNLNYGTVLRNLAIETIKNNATLFSADEYLTIRRTIENTFREEVTKELKENGLVEVFDLQLKAVEFPSSFYRRKLDAGIQVQKNLIEGFVQNVTVIREETANQVLFIENDGKTALEGAIAEANLIRKQGLNNATKIRGSASIEGLDILAASLNVTEQRHKMSLNYLINIKNNKGVSAYINFDEMGSKKEL